jgi:hypothetical protein
VFLIAIHLVAQSQVSQGVGAQIQSVELADGILLAIVSWRIMHSCGMEVTVASIEVEVIESVENLRAILGSSHGVRLHRTSEAGEG